MLNTTTQCLHVCFNVPSKDVKTSIELRDHIKVAASYLNPTHKVP